MAAIFMSSFLPYFDKADAAVSLLSGRGVHGGGVHGLGVFNREYCSMEFSSNTAFILTVPTFSWNQILSELIM